MKKLLLALLAIFAISTHSFAFGNDKDLNFGLSYMHTGIVGGVGTLGAYNPHYDVEIGFASNMNDATLRSSNNMFLFLGLLKSALDRQTSFCYGVLYVSNSSVVLSIPATVSGTGLVVGIEHKLDSGLLLRGFYLPFLSVSNSISGSSVTSTYLGNNVMLGLGIIL